MSLKSMIISAALAVSTVPALAGDNPIVIKDAYARSSAKSGAAFFMIMNHGTEADRLVAARSDVAQRVELHTHTEDANGVMRMREIEGGISVPAGGMYALKRGGDHIMFMGLSGALEPGSMVDVTLVFEKAGEIDISVPVDNDRKAGMSGHTDH